MKLADLFVKLGLKKDGFDKGIDSAKSKTNAFGSAVKKIGGIVAGAFAVERVASFVSELVQLGGVADGVREAFKRIADDRTLQGLKEATRGTVSELELMKRAVSAQNLGLPVDNLASLFEFATKRAQDTGESVDYLVNSIVTGIGRKSPLILDNLGISAIQLREKLHGVGMETASVADVAAAVGEIAAESMRQSGDIIDTAGIKIQQNIALWQDLKTEWGTLIANSDLLSKGLSKINDDLTIANSELPWYQKWWYRITFQHGKGAEAAKKYDENLKKQNKTTSDANTELSEFNNLLEEINVNAEENNKIWEEKFKLWDKQNKAIAKSIALTDSITESTRGYNEQLEKAYQSSNKFFTQKPKDVSGIVGGGGVFDMFDAEQDLDLGIDTEAIVEQIQIAEDAGRQIGMAFESGLTNAITGIGDALGEAMATGEWDNFGRAVLGVIGGFLKQMGAALIAYGIAMDAFKKAFTNPFAAIAAGVALVAIGSAISSLASSGPGGSASYSGASSAYSSSGYASAAIAGDVRFVLEGDKLLGAIDGSKRRRSITG